jgi:hypothetical protein
MNAAYKTRTIAFFCAIARQPYNPIVNVLGCSVIKILICDVIGKKTLKGIILEVENVLRATCRFRMVKPAIQYSAYTLFATLLLFTPVRSASRIRTRSHACHPVMQPTLYQITAHSIFSQTRIPSIRRQIHQMHKHHSIIISSFPIRS